MIITSKRRLYLDIWLKTLNQDIDIKDMILTKQYKKAIKQIEINSQHHYLLGLCTKEAYYASYISFYLKRNDVYLIANT